MFKEDVGKREGGCPKKVLRTSEIEENNIPELPDHDDYTSICHPLKVPFHIQLRKHSNPQKGKCVEKTKRKIRAINRLKNYFKFQKLLKKYVISSILNKDMDNRPYININIDQKFYYALLDSGASKSVIGGTLANSVQGKREFKRCIGNVRTADGQRQSVVGTVVLCITFQNQTKQFEFLVVPSIRQDVICGYDFWEQFGLKISMQTIGEISLVENDSDKLQLSMVQENKLNKVVAAFPDSEVEGLGCTTLINHHIDTGDARPIKQRYYPISPAVEKQLGGEIDRMISLGVIEEAPNSAWSSPTVVIVKPGKVRMCFDSRKLNGVTKKDAYPIPNIDGILARLPPVYCISKIDLKDAFWQIKLDDESKPKTAFTVPNRPLYQFTRMPFGLCNAPQSLCRLMDVTIPYNLKAHVFVYLDDLLVVSNNFDEHLSHLLEVASHLRKSGLTINVKKSSFALNKVKYLGYVVGNGTLQVDEDKVSAINEIPPPKSIKQVRRFLGMTGWYRRFIQDYSAITYPLTELLSKRKTFVWTDVAQEAFNVLKQKLTTAPLLAHPNYEKMFILQCDASTYGVGAVLAQEDDEGHERPIAFMSQKLNKSQRNYTITELECLAVVLAIKKFRSYIEGQEFKVITDHASLKWLMSQKDLTGRLARWSLKIQGFHFSIEHRKGKYNVVPDALSRVNEGKEAVEIINVESCPSIDLDSEAFNSGNYANLRNEYLNSGLPDFKVVDSYIYKRMDFARGDFDESDSWKLMVPEELRKDVIYVAHDTPNSAHSGVARTLERIRRYFYWAGMVSDVKKYIMSCELCKTSKTPSTILRPPMGQRTETERPFQRLFIDLIGPLPRTKSGNIGILIILDHFSKFVFLKPLKKLISKPILEYLRNDVFSCFGVPEVVLTDNGSQFKSKDFESFLGKHGVKHVFTALYSPQANASERVNRVVNEALRSYIRHDQREWDVYLSSINCAIRNSVHQSMGRTPYQIVFGQNMLTHGGDYNILRRLKLLSESDIKLERQDEFSLLRASIQENVKKAYEKNERIYNLRSRLKCFEVGQNVIRRNFIQSSKIAYVNAKLAPVGVRAKVIKRIGQVYYELQDLETGSKGVYHAKDIWT